MTTIFWKHKFKDFTTVEIAEIKHYKIMSHTENNTVIFGQCDSGKTPTTLGENQFESSSLFLKMFLQRNWNTQWKFQQPQITTYLDFCAWTPPRKSCQSANNQHNFFSAIKQH